MKNQLLTGGADLIGSNCGYEIVEKYRTLRKHKVTPKPMNSTRNLPITFII